MENVFVGPDPNFPYLNEYQRFCFPDPCNAKGDVIAMGGNLSPGMLLSAYEQGIFPWYNPWEPVLWQSPDPRFVIFPKKLHISTSMKKILRHGEFSILIDRDFPSVIRQCSDVCRKGQRGTWISKDIIKAYCELYKLGYAHSAETYIGTELVGGCYGLVIGKIFFGESMFAKKNNASKAAFLYYAERLISEGITLIDCQVPTDHLRSLGAEEIDRRHFLAIVREAID